MSAKERKTRNHQPIDLRELENLLAGGCSVIDAARILNYSRETLYVRARSNAALKEAIQRGLAANESRKQKLAEGNEPDAGAALSRLLNELQHDIRELGIDLLRQEKNS